MQAEQSRLNNVELSRRRAEYAQRQERAQVAMGPCGGEAQLEALLETLAQSLYSGGARAVDSR